MHIQTGGHTSASKSSTFVRKYLAGIILFTNLIVLLVFWGFTVRSNNLIQGQLLKQAQAFIKEIIITREWASSHGGVYVRRTPDATINPYLKNIPGLKTTITDRDGQDYILKNPALMTREISKLAEAKRIFSFKVTSLDPLNPANMPDDFEVGALASISQGRKDYHRYETRNGEMYLRYVIPLVTNKTCLQCHGHQGYREGDMRGAMSITVSATEMMQELRDNRTQLNISALFIAGMMLVIFRTLSKLCMLDLDRSERMLVESASRDYLTGLLNRNEALRRITEEVSRSSRNRKPLAFILIDIDHFKEINDTHGHATGDAVLKEFSRELGLMTRDYDIVCRYGGEEFLVVTPDASREKARELAERIRATAMQLAVTPPGAEVRISITLSAGVAIMEEGENFEKVVSRADTALYRAKESGRNCIVLS